MDVTIWSPDSAVTALEKDRISHPFPGLAFLLASSGLLPSWNNLVFRTSVLNRSAHPTCSNTEFCWLWSWKSFGCVLDKDKWLVVIQKCAFYWPLIYMKD